jgi:hypothetical protein
MPNVLEIGRWCHVYEGQMKAIEMANQNYICKSLLKRFVLLTFYVFLQATPESISA